VLFVTEGAIVAGQMGMTMTVLNAVFALVFSWMTTKVPIYSNLIASKKYDQLDVLFNKTLLQSALIIVSLFIMFFVAIFLLRHFEFKIDDKIFADRFLSNLPLLFMMTSIVFNHFVSSWALYMRCHKKEPMLLQSLFMGLFCSASTFFLGYSFGVMGITLGYMVLTIVGFIWTFWIFKHEKFKFRN
jgi:hypothetical protein